MVAVVVIIDVMIIVIVVIIAFFALSSSRRLPASAGFRFSCRCCLCCCCLCRGSCRCRRPRGQGVLSSVFLGSQTGGPATMRRIMWLLLRQNRCQHDQSKENHHLHQRSQHVSAAMKSLSFAQLGLRAPSSIIMITTSFRIPPHTARHPRASLPLSTRVLSPPPLSTPSTPVLNDACFVFNFFASPPQCNIDSWGAGGIALSSPPTRISGSCSHLRLDRPSTIACLTSAVCACRSSGNPRQHQQQRLTVLSSSLPSSPAATLPTSA